MKRLIVTSSAHLWIRDSEGDNLEDSFVASTQFRIIDGEEKLDSKERD